MEPDEILICRLCFEICKTKFQIIENTDKEILAFLQMKLNFDISNAPVICSSCLGNLRECFNFKIDCLHKRGDTSVKHEDMELGVASVCPGENVAIASEMFYSNCKCCYCMELVNLESSVLLMNEGKPVTTLLEKYFPELLANGSMCIACYKSLQNQLTFISNCLTMEEKIQEYCKAEGTNSKNQVQLSSVLHFVSKDRLQNNIHSDFSEIKLEKDCEEIETEDEIVVKNEDVIETEEPGIYCYEHDDTDIKVEQDDNRLGKLQTLQKDGVELYSLTEKNTSGATVLESAACMHRSRQEGDLSSHMPTHEHPLEVTVTDVEMFKCEMCTYQSKRKDTLIRHMVTHTHSSEVTAYKCEICPFKTKHKRGLTQHMLTHKNSSGVRMFKCARCTYQSIRRSDITRHMLTCTLPSEVVSFKCELCTFEAKHEKNLQQHMVTYEHTSKVRIFKCNMCTYQNKIRSRVSRHMLIHKSRSEVTMYKCEMCSFQTRYKKSLRTHRLVHGDPSEAIMYKCKFCPYQSRHKGSLPKHILLHKDPSDVVKYKCEICTYQSIYKGCVLRHMLTHKEPSDATMQKCEIFTYQTPRKNSLSKQILSHKKPSEVTMYKCQICTYQTPRKNRLTRHVLTHTNASKMYQCEICPFESKRKHSLNVHMLTHTIISNSTTVNQYWENSDYNIAIIIPHIAGKI